MPSMATGLEIDNVINFFHQSGRISTGTLTGKDAKSAIMYFNDSKNESVVRDSIQRSFLMCRYGVYVKGRIDQIRQNTKTGGFEVWDIKYSSQNENILVQTYTPVLSIYAEALGVDVGGIVNVYNYLRPRKPVFIKIDLPSPRDFNTNIFKGLRDAI